MGIGMVASPAHVMSNRNIADKKACLRDITKQENFPYKIEWPQEP